MISVAYEKKIDVALQYSKHSREWSLQLTRPDVTAGRVPEWRTSKIVQGSVVVERIAGQPHVVSPDSATEIFLSI